MSYILNYFINYSKENICDYFGLFLGDQPKRAKQLIIAYGE